MSFVFQASSINAMTTAVPKLVHGLTRALFARISTGIGLR